MKNNISKLIVAAWIIIGLWFLRPIFFNMVKIDFASAEIARNFKQIWLILIPLAVSILAVKSWTDSNYSIKNILVLTLGILISFSLIFVINFLSDFCECQYSKTIFTHKTENIQIRERIIDCGAWDSDPTRQLVETYSLGNYLIKYSNIKEEDINPKYWIKE